MKLGEIINELRVKKNLTQSELAKKVGVKAIDISNIIHGKEFPNKELTMKLKKALED